MRLTELSLERLDQWHERYRSVGSGSIDVFDLPGYMNAWKLAGHGNPVCLSVSDSDSVLLYPFMINAIQGYEGLEDISDISSPYGYGGTIVSSQSIDRHFLSEANLLIDDWLLTHGVVSEFIRVSPYRQNADLRPADYVQVRTNVQVDIESVDGAWANLAPSARRNIRRSSRIGLVVEIDENSESLEEFIDLYETFAQSRNWTDFYKFSRDYFHTIRRDLPENSFIIRAEYKGDLAASALFLSSDLTTHYHLGASNPSLLKSRPNDAIFWEAIRYCASMGTRTLQLGGGTGLDDDDPLFGFKVKFGNRLLPVTIGKRIINQTKYDQLIERWSDRNPDTAATSSHILQRYRD